MKIYKIFRFIVLFFLIQFYLFSYGQISDIIPEWAFGEESSTDIIDSWINSGANYINNNYCYIENLIDVNEVGIYSGDEPIADDLQTILDNLVAGEQTMIYFPEGHYFFETTLKIPSNVILKGAGGDYSEDIKTTFFFDFETFDTIPSISLKSNTINSAIEDICLYDSTDTDTWHNYDDLIVIPNTASNCWLRGIESINTRRFHVNVYGDKITISGCYFHHARDYGGGGRGYGVCLSGYADTCRVEDNIFRKLRHSMVFYKNPANNVLAYNYSRDPCDNSGPTNTRGDLLFHGWDGFYPGAKWNLCEGNNVHYINFDLTHGGNGPYNTFMRCNGRRDGYAFKIAQAHALENQYKQNVVGTQAKPTSSTQTKIDEYGFSEFWDLSPNWANIPSNQATYYQVLDFNQVPREKPSFYYNTVSWRFPWPCLPGDLIPAKYRFDRNNNYYQGDPYTSEVVKAGWDLYNICGPPNIYLSNIDPINNTNEEYIAMNSIEIGPYEFGFNNNIVLKCESRIEIKSGFKVNSANNNHFHSIVGDICNTTKDTIKNGKKFPPIELDINSQDSVNHTKPFYHKSNLVNNLSDDVSDMLSIGPNPNNGIFSIFSSKDFNTSIIVRIFGINGNLVYDKTHKSINVITIDISDKPIGFYFLQIINNNKTFQFKFIINE